jgi:uncharacterized protein (DUF362 family)
MSKRTTTRREFLRSAIGAGAAAGLGGLASCPTVPLWLADVGRAATAILRAAGYDADLLSVIEQGMTLVPPPDVAGKRVLLKPNLVDLPREGRPVVTNPAVVVAAAEAFRRRGAAEVVVGDGPALQRDTWDIIDAVGLSPLLREHGLPFVDLSLDDIVTRQNAGTSSPFNSIYFAATVANTDVLVSMPKMKTHHWAGVSLSMKNLIGTTSGAAYGWPRNRFHKVNVHKVVVDINRTRGADYCIVDGITAMEGNGPIQGTAKAVGVLVLGDNATAVDATCARIMRLRPEFVQHIAEAASTIGPISEANIEQRGEPIASVAQAFDVLPHLAILKA